MSSAKDASAGPQRAIALLLVGSALVWLLLPAAPSPAGRPGTAPSGSAATAAAPEGTLMQPPERPTVARTVARSAQGSELDDDRLEAAPFSESRSIRVVGRVRRDGAPVDDAALSFRSTGAGGREVDWDVTDEDGRFEVYLPSAGYVVTCEEAEDLAVRIEVPTQVDAWTCDLELSRAR